MNQIHSQNNLTNRNDYQNGISLINNGQKPLNQGLNRNGVYPSSYQTAGYFPTGQNYLPSPNGGNIYPFQNQIQFHGHFQQGGNFNQTFPLKNFPIQQKGVENDSIPQKIHQNYSPQIAFNNSFPKNFAFASPPRMRPIGNQVFFSPSKVFNNGFQKIT